MEVPRHQPISYELEGDQLSLNATCDGVAALIGWSANREAIPRERVVADSSKCRRNLATAGFRRVWSHRRLPTGGAGECPQDWGRETGISESGVQRQPTRSGGQRRSSTPARTPSIHGMQPHSLPRLRWQGARAEWVGGMARAAAGGAHLSQFGFTCKEVFQAV